MATQIGSEAALSTAAVTVGSASLGIDGDKAYAVLGPDLQEGEAVFVAVRRKAGEALHDAQRRAAHQALEKLEERLGCELVYFWTPHAPVEQRK